MEVLKMILEGMEKDLRRELDDRVVVKDDGEYKLVKIGITNIEVEEDDGGVDRGLAIYFYYKRDPKETGTWVTYYFLSGVSTRKRKEFVVYNRDTDTVLKEIMDFLKENLYLQQD